MASRMDRYHSNSSNVGRRSVKNEGLYKDIYENNEYSNIEKVATMDKTNEISLDQIKDLLREREEKKKASLVKKPAARVYQQPTQDRSYDIRDVLIKAKDSYVDDNKNRSLKNTQYNILKNIDIKEKLDKYDQDEIEKTLVNTSVLKNLDDSELSLDMLSDLKSSGNTMVDRTSGLDLLQEVQEAKDKYVPKNDDGLDRSFYTSSLNFKDDDFEQLKDLQDSIESNNKMIKILFLLLFVFICVVIGYVLYKIF